MKKIEKMTHVCVLDSNQLKLIKSGTAPDCEGGQILNLITRECEPVDGLDNCGNGLP